MTAEQDNLLNDYVAGGDLLKRTIAGMSRANVLARPVPGKWSTLEVVCHLADFEPIFADRIKRILAMEQPLLMAADGMRYVIVGDLGKAWSFDTLNRAFRLLHSNPEAELIALTRQQLATILRAKQSEAFQRTGVHSGLGLVTVEQILTKATQHMLHHVPFIVEKKKALGLTR